MILASVLSPEKCLHFLRPGRLVRIQAGKTDWGWGLVVNVHRKAGKPGQGDQQRDKGQYIIDALLHCAPGSEEGACLDF